MGRVTSRTSPNGSETTAVLERELYRIQQTVANECERIEEVALPCPVGAYEDREPPEVDSCLANALVIPNLNLANPSDMIGYGRRFWYRSRAN
jgi:hypothetical protein